MKIVRPPKQEIDPEREQQMLQRVLITAIHRLGGRVEVTREEFNKIVAENDPHLVVRMGGGKIVAEIGYGPDDTEGWLPEVEATNVH